MDSMKHLVRTRRGAVVALVTYVAYLVRSMSSFIESLSEDEVSPEEFDQVDEKVSLIANSLGRIADALSESNHVIREGQHHIYGGDEVFKELEKLELADTNFLVKACILLIRDQAAAECFFGCPSEMRKDWLLWKMSRQSQ